jgi:hypothetical protein
MLGAMLFRHRGLIILLLAPLAGQATLLERWLGSSLRLSVVCAVLFAPIALALLGALISEEATSARVRRWGFGVTFFGALLHLFYDLACVALPFVGSGSWGVKLAGVAVGGIVMVFALREALRGVRDPDASPPSLEPVPRESGWARLQREAALVGGTAIALCLISLGMVAMACVALVRHPEQISKGLSAGVFFAACAVSGIRMGLGRRALLLGRPAPRLWPKRGRQIRVVATREGLTQIDRKGATVYPWELITTVVPGEYHHNPALFIELIPETWAVRHHIDGRVAPTDEKWRKRLARSHSIQRALTGSDLVIMDLWTEAGPGPLLRQMEAALFDAGGRAALPTLFEALGGGGPGGPIPSSANHH